MPELRGHVMDRSAAREQEARAGVAQVVEADLRQRGSLQEPLEAFCQRPTVERQTMSPTEHEVHVDPLVAEAKALGILAGLVAAQCVGDRLTTLDRAVSVLMGRLVACG